MLLLSYLKSGIRGILKNRFFTAVNLIGLTAGLTACLLILGYIHFETTYDRQYADSGSIYRVKYTKYDHGTQVVSSAKTPSRLAQVAPQEIPGVEASCRVYPEPCLVRYKDEKLANQHVLWVDQSFFQVFGGILIQGDVATALEGPDKMVVTQRMAYALFGDEDPIGKELKVNEGMPFVVTGVVKDPPANTHFKYEFLLSMGTFIKYGWMEETGDWYYPWTYTYLKADPNIPMGQVQYGLDQLGSQNFTFLKEEDQDAALTLQPVHNIHLESHEPDELEANGDLKYIWIIGGIAIAIMLIVWINFVNLSTAISLSKSKATGIRKTFGASRGQLITQYLIESVLINLIAMACALGLVTLFSSSFEQFMDVNLDFSLLVNPEFWLLATGVFLVGIVLSAFYPAVIVSSFKPIEALKNQVKGSTGSGMIRQSLITVQFIAAIFLTVGTLVVYQQVSFMRSHDLGAKMDQLLVMRGPTTLNAASDDTVNVRRKITLYDHFRKELKQHSFVKQVTSAFRIPGEDIRHHTEEILREDTGVKMRAGFKISQVDDEFFPAFEIDLLAGQNFERDFQEQRMEVILNEQAARDLGFESAREAVGNTVSFWDQKWRIIGVVKDFHQKALSETISPILFVNRHAHEFGFYIVKLTGADIRSSVSQVEAKWKEVYPEDPFLTFFADDFFNRQYDQDEQFGRIFTFFAILSILIANLGLVALTSLTVARRMKEIGIRKVLGANVRQIVVLISKSFLKPIGVAALIAFPIVWLFLSYWLQNFAYHIDLNPIWMILCALVIFMVSLANVGYYVSRLTTVNPTDVLRSE